LEGRSQHCADTSATLARSCGVLGESPEIVPPARLGLHAAGRADLTSDFRDIAQKSILKKENFAGRHPGDTLCTDFPLTAPHGDPRFRPAVGDGRWQGFLYR
jgi:hypothetical protein